MIKISALLLFALAVQAFSQTMNKPNEEIAAQVRQRETEFAKTMTDRNFDEFSDFVSEEAIFLSRDKSLYGRDEITNRWKNYYESDKAPFTWQPDIIEVLPSGKLAISIGKVFVEGKFVSRFSSTWRLETDGKWRVIFDHGYKICE